MLLCILMYPLILGLFLYEIGANFAAKREFPKLVFWRNTLLLDA